MPDDQQTTTTKKRRRRRTRPMVDSFLALSTTTRASSDAPTGDLATAKDKEVLAADVALAGLIPGAPRQTLPTNANVIGMLPWAYLPRRQYGAVDLATLPHDTLEPQQLMELLADASPDVSLALDNILRLAGADWEFTVRTPDNSDDDPTGKANLDALVARVNSQGGGFEQLLNQWTMSVALQGACAGETIPTLAIDDVEDIVAVQPWTVFFQRNLAQRLVPYQWQPMMANASAAFLGAISGASGAQSGQQAVPNPLLPAPTTASLTSAQAGILSHGGFRQLNEDTFGYSPLDAFVDDPYGRMPFASVMQVLAFDAQLLKDLRQWSHVNAFGRLDISVAAENALKLIPAAVANNAAERLKWLTSYLQTIQSAHNSLNPDDTFVHWDNVTVGSVESAGQTLNIDNIIRAIERRLFRALKQLPLMMGSNEGTTETWGSIQMEVQALRIQSIQKTVASLATRLLTVALRLRGQTGIVHFEFARMRSTDRIKDATADMLEAKYAATLRDQGWIDQDEASIRVTGSKAVKSAPNPDPVVAPEQPDSGSSEPAPPPPEPSQGSTTPEGEPPPDGAGGGGGTNAEEQASKEAQDGAQDRASQQRTPQQQQRTSPRHAAQRAPQRDAPRDASQDAQRDASDRQPQGDGQHAHGAQQPRERGQAHGGQARHGDPLVRADEPHDASSRGLSADQLVDQVSQPVAESMLALEAYVRTLVSLETRATETRATHQSHHPARAARAQALTAALRAHFEAQAERGVPDEVLRHLAATHTDRAAASSRQMWPPLAEAVRKVADAWDDGTQDRAATPFSADEHAALVASVAQSLRHVFPEHEQALTDTLTEHASATYEAGGQTALDELHLSGTFQLRNTQTKAKLAAAAQTTTAQVQATTRSRVATALANTLEAGPPTTADTPEDDAEGEGDETGSGAGGGTSAKDRTDLLVTLLAAAAVATLRHMATGDPDANDGEGSLSRAEIIGATETTGAWTGAKVDTYSRNGVSMKVWVTTADPDPGAGATGETPCRDNAYASPIPVDAAFPSGDQAPPAHTKCGCDVAPGSDPSELAMAEPWTGD